MGTFVLTETTVTLERTGKRMLTKLVTYRVAQGTSSPPLGAQKLCPAVITFLQDLKVDNIEKAREFQRNIYFCFIDYAKAFDCVDHNKL